jgi:hypothetical protein
MSPPSSGRARYRSSAARPAQPPWFALREDAGMSITDATRLAVLIDSDNTTAGLTTELLEEIAKYGTPTIKRAYGDWTTTQLTGWKLRHRLERQRFHATGDTAARIRDDRVRARPPQHARALRSGV